MSAKKKTISRVLCLVMIVALIVPALLVVPVSAETQMYLYNGVDLPALPEWDKTVYPYATIYLRTTSTATYTLLLRTDAPYVGDNSSGYASLISDNGHATYYYRNSEWEKGEIVQSGGSSVRLDRLSFLWTSYDILNKDGSVYLAASIPVPVGSSSVIPDFGVLQSWLDTDAYTFVENSSATSFTVAVDGGSAIPTYQYQWYYGSSQGGTFNAIPNETQASFTPKTTAEYIGTSLYFCRITAVLDGVTKSADSGYLQVTVTEEPPPTTDPPATEPSEPDTPDAPDETTPDYSEKLDDIQGSLDDVNNSIGEVGDKVDELPDKITDGMQDIMEQEKEQATQQGGQFVDDIAGVVPNDSQGFIDALGSLVSVLSYDGTECVLPIPALTLPAIGGLFPSYTVMEAQEVDFEEFFSMMPPAIMLLVQSLLTVALIVYCFKELYDSVAYFFVLKGGNK